MCRRVIELLPAKMEYTCRANNEGIVCIGTVNQSFLRSSGDEGQSENPVNLLAARLYM